MDDKKIAVLIDAENVSGKYIKLILDEVSNYGSATYKRLYGDFQTPSVRAWMKNLRDYANLTKSVTVVGCNNHAELWDSARWNEIHDAEMTPDNIAAVMEELEF